MKKVFAIVLTALFMSTLLFQASSAQMRSARAKDDDNEVKKYFVEKYKLKPHDVMSEVKQTPDGPSGYLSVRGVVSSKTVPVTDDPKDRLREIAKAFLKEEAAVLGIAKMDEIRETWFDIIKRDDGRSTTNIRYKRFINDIELNSMYIQITFASDETIKYITAELVPSPPALYRAVKQKTLSENDIKDVVMYDLKADAKSPDADPMAKHQLKQHGPGLDRLKMKKFAISSPPHVVWEAKGIWHYTINAFNGEILEKMPSWKH